MTFYHKRRGKPTSPMLVGVAPISCCRRRMSRVGPVMSEVPVSTMASQPLGQKESTPCTATLPAEAALLRHLRALAGPPGTHLSTFICQ